jgi:hypothetical protein
MGVVSFPRPLRCNPVVIMAVAHLQVLQHPQPHLQVNRSLLTLMPTGCQICTKPSLLFPRTRVCSCITVLPEPSPRPPGAAAPNIPGHSNMFNDFSIDHGPEDMKNCLSHRSQQSSEQFRPADAYPQPHARLHNCYRLHYILVCSRFTS